MSQVLFKSEKFKVTTRLRKSNGKKYYILHKVGYFDWETTKKISQLINPNGTNKVTAGMYGWKFNNKNDALDMAIMLTLKFQ